MSVMFVLLLIYTVIQGHWEWFDSRSYEAQCIFDDLVGNIGRSPAVAMRIGIVLLVTAYGRGILA